MPQVSCDGRTISYEAGGRAGAPLLVFQPPGASGASIWRRIANAFQDDYRTVAINPSDYGETEPFAGEVPMSVWDEAAAVEAVIHAESRGQQGARMVGHSYGGTIALVLAGKRPDLIAGLTLFEPAPYALLRDAGEIALSNEISGRNRQFIETVQEGGRDAEAMEQYLDYFNNQPGFWKSLKPEAQTRMLALSERLAISLDAVERLDLTRDQLSALSMPVSVTYGSRTDPLHARLCALIADAIPDASLHTIQGAGHMMTMTHGKDAVARIREDLDRE